MQSHNYEHDGHYEEVIPVAQKRVACDGGVAGHPRVWLTLDSDTHQVVCPYCSRLYAGEKASILQNDSQADQASQENSDG